MNRSIFLAILLALIETRPMAQVEFGPQRVIIDGTNYIDYPGAVRAVDLDGDGYRDVLASARFSDEVVWFRNNQNGGYSTIMSISSNLDGAHHVEAADLDGDGDADVVAHDWYGKIYWFENAGNGAFSDGLLIDDVGVVLTALVLTDLDGDGDNDLLASTDYDDSGKCIWYENNGSGEFSEMQSITPDDISLSSMHTGDLDNDGDIDVLPVSIEGEHVFWYENLGAAEFTLRESPNALTYSPAFAKTADLDADGDIDLVLSGWIYNEKALTWYENDGEGNFSAPTLLSDSLGLIYELDMDDLDNDGDMDIVVGSAIGDKVVWFENDGSGNFSDEKLISRFAKDVESVVAADMNNDGDVDVLAACAHNGKLTVYENVGMGNFADPLLISGKPDHPSDVHAADLDGDGDLDVLSASRSDDKIAWYENDGTGNFSTLKEITVFANDPLDVHTADLDNDGDMDVLSASFQDNVVGWYENDGTGRFGARKQLNNEGEDVHTVYTADLDGDGDEDVISADFQADEVFWFRNEGSGNFSTKLQVETDSFRTPSRVYAADLDGDGDQDVLAGSFWGDEVAWYRNGGTGHFSSRITLSLATTFPSCIGTSDLDSDGDIDVVLSNGSKVAWLENDGFGNFSEEQIISDSLEGASSFHLSDIDFDGKTDILVVHSAGVVGWYKNLGAGSFSERLLISNQVNSGIAIMGADMDGDGYNDVVIASSVDDKIAWYENLMEEALTTISGRVFWDKNHDEVLNDDDVPLSGHRLLLQPGDLSFYCDEEGVFSVVTEDTGSHSIEVLPPIRYDCNGLVDMSLSVPDFTPYTFEYAPHLEFDQDFIFKSDGAPCRNIGGNVFDDQNQNTIQDPAENGLSGVLLKEATTGSSVFSNFNGDYSIEVPNSQSGEVFPVLGSYSCELATLVQEQTFPISNGSYPFEIGITDIDSFNFGIYTQPEHSFEVGIYSLMVMNGDEAGEHFHAYMDFKASGEIANPCTLRIEHDPLLTLLSADIPPLEQAESFVEWVFPVGTAPNWYCMEMEWILDDSAVEGDTLHWEASYECPPEIDNCPDNNLFVRDVPVTSGPLRMSPQEAKLYSMDASGIKPEVISRDELLSYVITFKNPLPTTAYNVTIVDQLSGHLDPSTVSRPFSSFPDDAFIIDENGTLRWELTGVDLTVADQDDVHSHGFVQFNVRLKDDLPDGTRIPNRATVIFNGIEALKTNEVIHKLEFVSSVSEDMHSALQAFVYPNPFRDQTSITFREPVPFPYDLELVDLLGRQVKFIKGISNASFSIDLPDLTSGMYILNLFEHDKREIQGTWKLMVE